MLTVALLSFSLVAGAGEIYHCADGAGGIRFSDVPCTAGADGVAVEALGDRDARAWLDELRAPRAPAIGGPSPRVRAWQEGAARTAPRTAPSGSAPEPVAEPGPALPGRPPGEARLAACSLVFYECTRGDAASMDRCITEAPVCGRAAGSCCEAAYVTRYELLRRHGYDRRAALRGALLGLR